MKIFLLISLICLGLTGCATPARQTDRETAAETAQVRSSACSAHARTRTRPHAHARTHTPARHCWT